jgi:hypothetical protein
MLYVTWRLASLEILAKCTDDPCEKIMILTSASTRVTVALLAAVQAAAGDAISASPLKVA